MDAMPITLAQSLESWSSQIDQNIKNIEDVLPKINTLAQGGTAVGTGINTHKDFSEKFIMQLSEETSINFKPADNFSCI